MTRAWFTAEVDPDWVPGDPLWSRENHPNSNYLLHKPHPTTDEGRAHE